MFAAVTVAAAIAATPGACHAVHGRMSLWNGAPTVRIAVAGTHRVLGVVQAHESFDDLPASVRSIWTGRDAQADWAKAIEGDFTVCPIAGARSGRALRVRLVEASHLSPRPR